jgi:hypothetical protein
MPVSLDVTKQLKYSCQLTALSQVIIVDTVLDDASMVRDIPCFTIVATALAQRRRRVLNIARRILPSHTFNLIPQSNLENLDTELGNIVQALQKSGVSVDPHFISVTDRSVYHTQNLLPDTAELLYNLGFNNLEGRDERGMTPLASVFDGNDSKIKLAMARFERCQPSGSL